MDLTPTGWAFLTVSNNWPLISSEKNHLHTENNVSGEHGHLYLFVGFILVDSPPHWSLFVTPKSMFWHLCGHSWTRPEDTIELPYAPSPARLTQGGPGPSRCEHGSCCGLLSAHLFPSVCLLGGEFRVWNAFQAQGCRAGQGVSAQQGRWWVLMEEIGYTSFRSKVWGHGLSPVLESTAHSTWGISKQKHTWHKVMYCPVNKNVAREAHRNLLLHFPEEQWASIH